MTQTQSHTETCPLCNQPLAGHLSVRELEGRMAVQVAEATRVERAKIEGEVRRGEEERMERTLAGIRESHAAEVDRITTERVEEVASLQKQMGALQDRLTSKQAGLMGEGAEINLHESLRKEFPHDRVERVPKGPHGGPDVRHQVRRDDGEAVGLIIYESKDAKKWMGATWISKLRDDKINEGADHAVLSTATMPSGASGTDVIDGVVVTTPGHVVGLAKLLRGDVIQAAKAKQSASAGDVRKDELYQFISSQRYANLVNEMTASHSAIREWEAEDTRHVKSVWTKRRKVLARMNATEAELEAEIAALME